MAALSYLRRAGLALTMLACSTALSQVVELTGGASTLYGAQGGTVTIRGEQMQTSFGAGLVGRQFAAGGSSIRQMAHGSLTAGQQELRLDLPTDVFEESHLLFGAGLGLRERSGGSSLTLFGGMASAEGGTPLFETASPHGMTFFGDWRAPLSSHCWLESMALLARSSPVSQNDRTLLESAECAVLPGLRLAVTAGEGGGSGYEAASLEMQRRRFTLKAAYINAGASFERSDADGEPAPEPLRGNVSAEVHLSRTFTLAGLHRNYLSPPLFSSSQPADSAVRSSLDQVSLESHTRYSGWQVSLLHSTAMQPASASSPAWQGSDLAWTAGWSHTFSRLQWTENWLHAHESASNSTSLLISGLSWNVNAHLQLTESANLSGPLGRPALTFSHGGTWLTSFSSLSVSYQLLYVANRPGSPFQQTMVFDAGTRLFRGLSVHAASSVGPTGAVYYTFQLGKVFARDHSAIPTITPGELGAYALCGRVVDSSGRPVEGAALLIGEQRVYTGSDGEFFFRERRRHTHPLRVLPDEFLSLEHYSVVSAPAEVTTTRDSGPSITIVVTRREDASVAAANRSSAPLAAIGGSR